MRALYPCALLLAAGLSTLPAAAQGSVRSPHPAPQAASRAEPPADRTAPTSGARAARRGDWFTALGGRASSGVALPGSIVVQSVRRVDSSGYTALGRDQISGICWDRWEVVFSDTGTGWSEAFLIQEPCNPFGNPELSPLLVLWHKFGSSHRDTEVNTEFFELAGERGWHVVAPLSAATRHYGSPDAHANTRVVLDYALQVLPLVDLDRIYAVGFSMGGGAMLSHAARHLDPQRGMFAALVSHTGGGSLKNTYYSEPDDDDVDDTLANPNTLEIPDILDFWFGGSPTVLPFEYQRFSVIDMDSTGGVHPETSMLTNLSHVPLYTLYANSDPVAYIVDQSVRIAVEHEATFGGTSDLDVVPGSAHSWSTLDEQTVIDWLEGRVLTLPTSGRTLADRDGVWFYFDLEQDAPGAFTRFDWSVDANQNHVAFGATENLWRIRVNASQAGLDPAGDLTIELAAADGTGDEVRISQVPAAPVLVLRDGQVVSQPAWSYDAPTETLTLIELDPQPHVWQVVAP